MELSGISTPSSAGCSILERLKRETRASHEDLERRADVMRRVQTVAGYRGLLEDFYGLFSPLEAQLGSSAELTAWVPDLLKRMRMPALLKDLAELGNVRAEALPLAPVPTLSSLPTLFGCLYVLEGSTLGGRIIARHVSAVLPEPSEHSCSFFAGRGVYTGDMWNTFRGSLEYYAISHPENGNEIIDSAIGTFRVFAAWIEKPS